MLPIKTSSGEIKIDIPRDPDSSFDPIAVPKHERMSQKVEDAIISLYAKGLTVTDIEEQIREIYSVKLSPASVSNKVVRTLMSRYMVLHTSAR